MRQRTTYMEKALRKILGVLLALMLAVGLFPQIAGVNVKAASPFEGLGINAVQVNYKHAGKHDYQVEDPDWVNAYCMHPSKGYSDDKTNQNFRWKADLKANPDLIRLNGGDVNGSNKPDGSHINRLVSILWQAQQMNAGLDDTQSAVWWFITNGAADYASNLSSYNNFIVKAAGDSGWAVPQDYALWIYAPDTQADSSGSLQNLVRLDTNEPGTPSNPPAPPQWEINTKAIYNNGAQTGEDGKPITIQLKPGQTKTDPFILEESIQYSNMTAEAGHKIWLMMRLVKVNEDGSTEELRNRGTQDSGDVFYMGEGDPWKVDASGAGEWLTDAGGQLTFYNNELEPGTYYLAVEVYDPETGVKLDHNDPEDQAEMIIVKPAEEKELPMVATSASPKKIDNAKDQTITDTVTLTNLAEGVEYTITGRLMDKAENAEVTTAVPLTFTASADDAAADSVTKEMTFTVDASDLTGKELVVFETLSWESDAHGDTKEVKHEDLEDEEQTVSVKGEEHEIVISKQNLLGKEIEGAKIQILQGEDVVEEWTSVADESHTVKLEAGEYTFHEVSVPEYYSVVTDIDFTVTEDGKVEVTAVEGEVEADGNKLIVTDKWNPELPYTPGEVLISKVDLDGEELPGAEIEILDADGEVIDSWTSTDEVHTIEAAKIEPGATYTFHEVAAPEGYAVVTDISFKVTNDGIVEVLDVDSPSAAAENNKLIITDDYDETETAGSGEGTLSTTVSAGGKTATSKKAARLTADEAAKVTTVTDTIKAKDLAPETKYKVSGELMKVSGKKAVSTGFKATGTFETDEDGNGTWKMDFKNVKLAAGTKYVVFETAVNTEDKEDVIEHKDINDKAQTLVVGTAVSKKTSSAASSSRTSAVKTGDTSNAGLWGMMAVLALIAAIFAGVELKHARK